MVEFHTKLFLIVFFITLKEIFKNDNFLSKVFETQLWIEGLTKNTPNSKD